MIALCYAVFLKQEEPANDELNNNIDDMEAALLS